ncbi:MAG: hypothetical protein EBU42_09240, partial [Synechococcus sp.]|nr:hypothetical protein [Synechococcus sp.]
SGIADGALRINWSRGSGGRGLQPPAQAKGRCWGSLYPHQPSFQRQQVVISERVQRWADDPLKGCKTLDYSAMVLARLEALLNSLDCRPLNHIAEPLAEPLFVQLLGSD